MREIAKFIRLTRIAAFNPTHDGAKYNFAFPDGRATQFCLLYIVPIIMGLSVYNRNEYEMFINGKNSTPLIDLLSDEKDYLFKSLLEHNETFNNNETGKTLVKFEYKLTAIYNALFVNDFNEIYNVDIGEYSFDAGVKGTILKTVSLLSNYINLHIGDIEE